MKILVTGGSGLIGYKLLMRLVKANYNVDYTYLVHKIFVENATSHKLDVSERLDTFKLLNEIKPDVTIHTVALTNVDLCETNHELADKINVEGTRNIVDACKEVNSRIIFVSTSAVFDGKKKVYTEDDKTNPTYYYALTKVKGENIVSTSGLPFLILRTDQPYCWLESWQKEKTSVLWVLKKLESGEETSEVEDWYNNPTFVDNFAEATIKLIKNDETGIYHISGPDFLNRYELALKVAEIFNKNKDLVKPINSKELNLPAKRVNVNLSNEKAQNNGIKLMGIDEGLKTMLDQRSSVL